MLPEIIDKYNRTYHCMIKYTPALAREPSSCQHVFEAFYDEKQWNIPTKFNVGDRVCSVKKKKKFEKGFTPNWTEELFTINEVKDTNPITYTIEDTKGKGRFY